MRVCLLCHLVYFFIPASFCKGYFFIRKTFSVHKWKSFHLLTSCLYYRFHVCIVNDSDIEIEMIERSYKTEVSFRWLSYKSKCILSLICIKLFYLSRERQIRYTQPITRYGNRTFLNNISSIYSLPTCLT
jgi:hypothetical protein